MAVTLTFHGAAQNVTGSRYVLDVDDKRILVDCGYYQERQLKSRNWEPFPVPAESVDAVLLTHAHLDHCGLLPKLVREGFRGKICCTPATADIARIILLDAAKIQEEDAEFKRLRHQREGRKGPHPDEPLYTTEDAKRVFSMFSPVHYGKPTRVVAGVEATFTDAGHILGSSHVHVHAGTGSERRHIVFSGDVGRFNVPIVRDPTFLDEADYVVMESTYGNRTHGPTESIPDQLAEVINWTRDRGGNLLIPSFAVERTQELLFHLNGLLHEDRIPHLRVFVDSPMAIRVTEVFKRHPELMDAETVALLEQGRHPCDFPGLTMCRTVAESKSINHIKGTAIVIAGSGMCTGGRIKHHLVHNIDRDDSTLLFVGYQAVGTLGRIILEGADPVRILGQSHRVRARIAKIDGFSAHADRDELLAWVSSLKSPPRRVFVTHGEPDAAQSFARLLREKRGWETMVPAYGDSVVLT
jgi:metallo-beta-lactamase family protein